MARSGLPSHRQEDFAWAGGNFQLDAAFVIRFDGRFLIECVERNCALLPANLNLQSTCCDNIVLSLQPLTSHQHEDCWRFRL